jgi:hypothetical protein
LIAGVVAIACAIILIAAANLRKVAVRLLFVAGAVGVAFPLYNLLTSDKQIDDAVNGASTLTSGLSQLGLTSQVFKDALSVKWGIAIWVCVAGGVLAIVSALLALRAPAPEMAQPAMTSPGFGVPMGASAPAPAPPISSPPPPMSAPTVPPETPSPSPSPSPEPGGGEPPTG